MPDTNPDAVKPLSNDEVAEVAAMFPHAEYQPEIVDEMPSCEFCNGRIDDHKGDCVVPHVHALCATVRALREKIERLDDVGLRNAQLVDRIYAWSKCEGSGYPLDEHINNIATQNTALREQLAEAQSARREQRETIKFWQRHIARMGKLLGTIAMDTEVEEAVKQLQSKLAQVTQEPLAATVDILEQRRRQLGTESIPEYARTINFLRAIIDEKKKEYPPLRAAGGEGKADG